MRQFTPQFPITGSSGPHLQREMSEDQPTILEDAVLLARPGSERICSHLVCETLGSRPMPEGWPAIETFE
jgi:hypothetical protein